MLTKVMKRAFSDRPEDDQFKKDLSNAIEEAHKKGESSYSTPDSDLELKETPEGVEIKDKDNDEVTIASENPNDASDIKLEKKECCDTSKKFTDGTESTEGVTEDPDTTDSDDLDESAEQLKKELDNDKSSLVSVKDKEGKEKVYSVVRSEPGKFLIRRVNKRTLTFSAQAEVTGDEEDVLNNIKDDAENGGNPKFKDSEVTPKDDLRDEEPETSVEDDDDKDPETPKTKEESEPTPEKLRKDLLEDDTAIVPIKDKEGKDKVYSVTRERYRKYSIKKVNRKTLTFSDAVNVEGDESDVIDAIKKDANKDESKLESSKDANQLAKELSEDGSSIVTTKDNEGKDKTYLVTEEKTGTYSIKRLNKRSLTFSEVAEVKGTPDEALEVIDRDASKNEDEVEDETTSETTPKSEDSTSTEDHSKESESSSDTTVEPEPDLSSKEDEKSFSDLIDLNTPYKIFSKSENPNKNRTFSKTSNEDSAFGACMDVLF